MEYRNARVGLVVDRDHYEHLITKTLSRARISVWIGTANVKEMLIEPPLGTVARARGKWESILETLSELGQRGVEVRVLHAGVPSRAFRATFARKKRALEMRRCPTTRPAAWSTPIGWRTAATSAPSSCGSRA